MFVYSTVITGIQRQKNSIESKQRDKQGPNLLHINILLLRCFSFYKGKDPRGYFQIRRSEGLGPHINFGGKIWGKVRPSSPNKRKNLGSSVTTRRKSWEKVPILGSYLKFRGQNLGYLSLIFLEAKFGAPMRISEANFGAKPPSPTS